MNKIAVGLEAKGVVDITAPVAHNLEKIAHAKEIKTDNLTVVILGRPRHGGLIQEVRRLGYRIRLILDGE